MKHPIVVGMTGASGAGYAVRLVDVLTRSGHDVHLSISPSGQQVIQQEISSGNGGAIDLENFDPASLFGPNTMDADRPGKIHYHHYQDFMTPIASGSFLTGGMVVCPCSGTTLSAVAAGASGNLIQRAAEVHLKERRRLILVPRETPLSLTHIENMRRAVLAGTVMLPASPGWYHGAQSVEDLIDFIVARICDQLGIQNSLIERWGER